MNLMADDIIFMRNGFSSTLRLYYYLKLEKVGSFEWKWLSFSIKDQTLERKRLTGLDLFGFLQVDFALQCPVEDIPPMKEQLNGQEHRVSL